MDPVPADEFSTDPDGDCLSSVTYEGLAVPSGVTDLQQLDNASGQSPRA